MNVKKPHIYLYVYATQINIKYKEINTEVFFMYL